VTTSGNGNGNGNAADYHRKRLADGAACLDAALDYVRRGWPALACCPPDHMGVGREHGKRCASPGKRPWHTWKEYQTRLPTEDDVRAWWHQTPTGNVGVALGPLGGIVRIDVDGAGGERLLAECSGGDLPPTLEFTSGRANGGRGILYAIPPGVTFKTTFEQPDKKEELRFQALGAQTVLPPSRHPDGTQYAWVPGHGPGEVQLAPAPAWVIARWSANGRGEQARRTSAGAAEGERITEGGRNATLASLAGTMRRRGFSREAIEAALLEENAARCDPPLDDEEVCTIAEHIAAYKPHEADGKATGNGVALAPSPAHLTDTGNAQRFRRDHAGTVRHCDLWGKWLVYAGGCWRQDDTQAVKALAKQTVLRMFDWASERVRQVARALEAAGEAERARAKEELAKVNAVLAWALRSEGAPRINAMLDLARSEPGIPVLPADLDRDPMLFNVQNGTIDLRTGRLREHRRDDLLTRIARVAFDASARCPTWERVVLEVMDDNADLAGYLQRVVGYCLTGDVREQCLFFLHGSGANGKSTLLDLLLGLLGDYGCQAVSELLLVKQGDAHPTERADLFGRRFVACVEVDEGKRLAEALLKQLTGGDRIRARRMREDFWEFAPTHKLFIAANHKPVIRGTDFAIWRRIKLIPFNVTFGEDRKDADLPRKLRAELPGVLNWALRGCLDWQRGGLGEPDEVRQAVGEYQQEMDLVARFISECCACHRDARYSSKALYEAFKKWCEEGGVSPPTRDWLGRRLKEKNFDNQRTGPKGSTMWHGLTLQAPEGLY
jgi:putative DNA primase/helicase